MSESCTYTTLAVADDCACFSCRQRRALNASARGDKPHGQERLDALRKGLLGVKTGLSNRLDENAERVREEAIEEARVDGLHLGDWHRDIET